MIFRHLSIPFLSILSVCPRYEVIRDALFANGQDQSIVKKENREVIILGDDSEKEHLEHQLGPLEAMHNFSVLPKISKKL